MCVKDIFESLHSERIIAKDILDQSDAEFSAAKYLWATWKAHGVMSGYLKNRFYEHPAITAVISRHLADIMLSLMTHCLPSCPAWKKQLTNTPSLSVR